MAIKVLEIQPLIKSKFRSYTVFCETMGRPNQRTWVTEWNRGKNLPSPEEAAKMCEILSVEPEQILVNPEDIALVRSLLDEKKPTAGSGEPGVNMSDWKSQVSNWTLEELADAMRFLAEQYSDKIGGGETK